MINVGINGFGRIGRNFFRATINSPNVNVVAINDLGDVGGLAHLLKYDSVHGILTEEVSNTQDSIVVAGNSIKVFSEKDPSQIPWKDAKVDVVIEATGKFTGKDKCLGHLEAGAKRVIISAPSADVDKTIVMGANEQTLDLTEDFIISAASCTTNCLVPVLKVLNEEFKIIKGMMTTIHSYTNDQRILDLPHKDLRRARAASLSQIPTSTGASKVVAAVLPELTGKITGMAVRVPTPDVSLIDVVVELESNVTVEMVNLAFAKYAENQLKGILGFNQLPLVSNDYKGCPLSSIVDGLSTTVIAGNMVKVLAWYDNEWGYSNRLLDTVMYMDFLSN